MTVIFKNYLNENKIEYSIIKNILKNIPLIDGHNDLLWTYRHYCKSDIEKIDLRKTQKYNKFTLSIDIPKLKEGLVSAQFWAIFLRQQMDDCTHVKAVSEQFDLIHRLMQKYKDIFCLAFTHDDIIQNHKKGKISVLIGIEGGHCIENSIPALRFFYTCGARYLTIAYMKNNDIIDSATDIPRHKGLSKFGKLLIKEMNKIGMMIDLSHSSPKGTLDVMDISDSPVILSHSNSFTITPHPRNAPDEVLKRIPENKGIIMVNFVPEFLNYEYTRFAAERKAESTRLQLLYPEDEKKVKDSMKKWLKNNPKPKVLLTDLISHIEHICEKAGIDHIGIGSDFEGFDNPGDGLEDASCYPKILVELYKRGFTKTDIEKIAGKNFLRIMKAVLK